MYDVTQDYIDKATAAGRVYSVQLIIDIPPEEETTPPEENPDETPTETPEEPADTSTIVGGADVLSMKIVRGQTTGSFTLGNTVCASLEATVANRVKIQVNAPIHVQIRFGEGESATEWQSLGYFYVDSIKQGQNSKAITAYDMMLQLSRIYISGLEYPTTVRSILNEIGTHTGIEVSENVHLFNDAGVSEKPQSGSQSYYTRRDILGYMAGINGGSAYIDVDGKINISAPTETGFTIYFSSATEQTVQDTNYFVRGVVWNTSNQTLSVGDNYVINTVSVYNPLSFVSQDQILENLNTNLVGLAFDSVTIKKQGTGLFQLGDLIDYKATDDKVYRMMVMGIVYDFSNGFFFETLYSMAQSSSQQRNQGNKINQDPITFDFPTPDTPTPTPDDTGKFAYTTGIHFKSDGFDLDFMTTDGEEHTNEFKIETSGGKITKLKNVTAEKEIEVTYE